MNARLATAAALLLAFGGALAAAARGWPWAWRALIVAAFAAGLFEWFRLLRAARAARGARAAWGWGAAGAVAVPAAGAVLLALPWQLALLLLAAVAAADTSAFLVGRRWGRRPLAPRISPGKTWAGFWAALAGAALAGLGWGALAADPRFGWPAVLLLGLLLGLSGALGDLAVSALKRAAGAKDSGRLLPGHGGALDRIDGLLLAAPAFAGLLALGPYPGVWDWR